MQMFFDGYYPELPTKWIYPGAEPRHIPDVPCVYIVVDTKGIVKYVGQTTSIRRRYKEHSRWMKKEDKIGWIECKESELLFLECWFIATLRPYRNANENKKAQKASSKRSARVSVKAKHVWQKGQKVLVKEWSGSSLIGTIEALQDKQVYVCGRWWSRALATVLI